MRIPLAGGPANAQADLPFQPDNLRWTPAGTLLVTGQAFDNYDDLQTCAGQGNNCPVGYQIMEIDPTTMTPSSRFTSDDPAFGLATVAAPVGDEVWVGDVRIRYWSEGRVETMERTVDAWLIARLTGMVLTPRPPEAD